MSRPCAVSPAAQPSQRQMTALPDCTRPSSVRARRSGPRRCRAAAGSRRGRRPTHSPSRRACRRRAPPRAPRTARCPSRHSSCASAARAAVTAASAARISSSRAGNFAVVTDACNCATAASSRCNCVRTSSSAALLMKPDLNSASWRRKFAARSPARRLRLAQLLGHRRDLGRSLAGLQVLEPCFGRAQLLAGLPACRGFVVALQREHRRAGGDVAAALHRELLQRAAERRGDAHVSPSR